MIGILLIAHMSASFAQRVTWFKFDEVSGTQSTVESISETSFDIQNNFNRPERIPGVEGSALRFDAWSTWIEKDFVVPGITNQMSIECWYATESFTAANSAIISHENASSGYTLEIEPYGKVVFIFWADQTRYVLVTDQTLEKYRWNHIVTSIDLPGQVARIYVNGNIWKEVTLSNHNTITTFNGKLYLGRDTDYQEFAGFPITMMNGALDELSIYNTSLSSAAIAARYDLYSAQQVDLTVDPDIRHANDRLRPRYHAMPNTSWTNECYGLIYHEGLYHLFFQKNPNGPYLYFMHWGHLTSPDMVTWTEQKIALAPSPGFDSFGIWSGTTIRDNNTGKPVIIYTGVNGAKAGIGVATSADVELTTWTKSVSNPVVPEAPANVKHLDFRDPYVWFHNGSYYMIVGSGLQFSSGGYLFTYKSTDLVNWTPIDRLYNDTNTGRSGFFWEMPFFYQLNGNDWMLSVTPTPSPGVRARTIYWIGKFENEKFVPYDLVPRSLELINENLLAPSIGRDAVDRLVYMGIIPEDRSVEDQVKAGWRHLFSLPRAIRLLNDSTIGQIPHPNLCRLRENEVQILDRTIAPGTQDNLPEISGSQVEVELKVKADSAAVFALQAFKNTDGSEVTSIQFDLANNKVKLDRSKSTLSIAAKDVRESKYVFDYKEPITVRLFLDHSTLEVFIDKVVVFSARVYPSKQESDKFDLVSQSGGVNVISLYKWDMKDMVSNVAIDVCEPDPSELPLALRDEPVSGIVTGLNDGERYEISVYPNPALERVAFRSANGKNFRITISDQSGKKHGEYQSRNGVAEIDVDSFSSGIYYVEILSGSGKRQYRKIVVSD